MTKVLMAYGDSNTHGTMPMEKLGDRDRFARDVRWPGVAQAALGGGWHVVEEGHPGRTSVFDDPTAGAHRNGLSVLPSLLESHMPIDVVAIMLGTNDLKMCHAMSPLDIGLAVERLVMSVRGSLCGPGAAAPDVLLIAPVPIRERGWLAEMFQGGEAKGLRLAAYLRDVAARQGVAFLDAGQVAEVDAAEGIHLTAEGHGAVGRAVAEAVARMV